jgi:hypothetical protein
MKLGEMALELLLPRAGLKDEYFGMMDEFEQARRNLLVFRRGAQRFAAYL